MSASITATVRPVPQVRRLLNDGSTVIAVVTLFVALIAVIFVPRFGTLGNIRALLLSVALTGIAAVGLSLITIVGRIFSLSLASTIALSTIVFAAALPAGPWVALLLATGFGALTGAVQGLIVGKLGTDPIITTIAFAAILLGAGELVTGGLTVSRGGDASVFGTNLFGVLPFQVFVFIIVTAVIAWWHKYTVQGRRLSLIGLNEPAAAVSGLRSWPLVLLAFTLAGTTAGLAGGLLSSQSGQGNLLLGGTFGFDAVTAVVVGGISVNGGSGSPVSAAVGALFVGLLGNVLVLVGFSYETQLVAKGLLVLLAVVLTGIAAASKGGRRR
ncbi:inner-membrane translocator [Arthrobacter crystallopoietes BAB-32]|uniref:Inner-membrane translocator n=1 Tax=Arthrobacter crystallopoietes BAB-32 TaxID=1246476 RepID=N1V485_9MICC|nr:ABC transporter permease [Arthrobacter crystallopoietes]EMY36165.1 inner-membrane translocator [Arthrobacter crystallopoietes BAB-32]